MNQKVAAQWCSRLVDSDAPLLRRLAVHSLSKREDFTPDDKIQWLLEHIDLHEYSIHHEVYQAVYGTPMPELARIAEELLLKPCAVLLLHTKSTRTMGKLRQGNISTGFIGSTNPIPLAPWLNKLWTRYRRNTRTSSRRNSIRT